MAADQLGLMQALGAERFHVIGHDRAAEHTGHRMALDHPDAVLTAARGARHRAHLGDVHGYQPQGRRRLLALVFPVATRAVSRAPDRQRSSFFYETCLVGWGAARVSDFDAEMLADYRRCWRDEGMIHGSCSDYRAAATIDLAHDAADLGRKVRVPDARGLRRRRRHGPAVRHTGQWRKRCADVTAASLPGGHFFVDPRTRRRRSCCAS